MESAGAHPDRHPGASAQALTEGNREHLLRVARESLSGYVRDGERRQFPTDVPALQRHQATFVTVRRRETGDLRGCRGEVQAVRPLIESVARMAIAAGADDSRFAPVSSEELPDLQYEINALGPFTRIDADDVVLGRHGLMIELRGQRGLLLPETPNMYGWDHGAYLRSLCRKAGLPDDAWRDRAVVLWGFESERWGDADVKGGEG